MALLHTLADIFSLIVEKKWTGTIRQSSNDENISSVVSDEEIKALRLLFVESGIAFGDRVIVQTDLSCRTVMCFIALWKIGAVVIPIKNHIHPEKILPLLKDSNARFIIKSVSNEIITLDSYEKIPDKFIFKSSRKVCGTDLALIIYSSGSTGVPKGIMLSHTNVSVAIASITDYLNLTDQDKILCISPLSFDYGLYQVLFSFYTNCDVILFNQQVNPLLILKAISEFSITTLPLVPSLATAIERVLHLFKTPLTSLKKITNTGGHLQESIIKELNQKLPHVQIYAMYGLTESKRVSYLPPQDLNKKLGSVGIPMPGLEAKVFKIIDELGAKTYIEAEPFEEGILFVRGPSVMQGYTNSNQEGAYIVSGLYRDDNWLCTNDIFYCDNDGYLYFKGREKDLIKQGGHCIFPKDIEFLISKNNNVMMVAVIDDKDIMGDEIAHCVIQIDSLRKKSDTETEIKMWIEENIDADYRPRKISFLSAMPLNDNGKIDKNALKKVLGINNCQIAKD